MMWDVISGESIWDLESSLQVRQSAGSLFAYDAVVTQAAKSLDGYVHTDG
jgi:hypothetical protein